MRARLVILNDSERPEAACIALVRYDLWTYISIRKTGSGYAGWNEVRRPQDHTPIEAFGVSAEVVNAPNFDRLIIKRVAPSIATYPDGVPRDWQAELPDGTGIRPELIDYVRKAVCVREVVTATEDEARAK